MVRDFKTTVLLIAAMLVISSHTVFADEMQDITSGIEAYKCGNYTECITKMKSVVKDDPTSAIAYYYLGLAYTKIDEKISAVENYNKVINLGSDNTLVALAKKGKSSFGEPKKVEKIEKQIEEIKEVEEEYNPIFNDSAITNGKQEVKKEEPKTTKIIKASDYAKSEKHNNSAKFEFDPNREPTNDEIVNAIKILQKAGLLQNGASAITGGGQQQMPNRQQMPQMDSRTQQMYSMMQMMNNGNNNNGMMNMMPYMNNGGKVDPQLMQMMLMQQMMPNFNGGNNNNNGY